MKHMKEFDDFFNKFKKEINDFVNDVNKNDINEAISNTINDIKNYTKNISNDKQNDNIVDYNNISEFIKYYDIVIWLRNNNNVLSYKYDYDTRLLSKVFKKSIDRISKTPTSHYIGEVRISFNPKKPTIIKNIDSYTFKRNIYTLSSFSINVEINTNDVLLDTCEYLYYKENGIETLDVRKCIDYNKIKQVVLNELSNTYGLNDDSLKVINSKLESKLISKYQKIYGNLILMIDNDIKLNELPDRLKFYIE